MKEISVLYVQHKYQGKNFIMTKFQVQANGTVFGEYEAQTEQEARDLCAKDAGYKSEADMVARLEARSELVATAVEAA